MLAVYEYVTLANGDICSVGNWVLAASSGVGSAVCRVEEIIRNSLNGQAPNIAQGVLLHCSVIGDFLDPYSMLAVTATEEFAFLPPTVHSISCPLKILIQYSPGPTLYRECPT